MFLDTNGSLYFRVRALNRFGSSAFSNSSLGYSAHQLAEGLSPRSGLVTAAKEDQFRRELRIRAIAGTKDTASRVAKASKNNVTLSEKRAAREALKRPCHRGGAADAAGTRPRGA